MNKVALITGSSKGIGREIALKFAKEGYDIIINSFHNKDTLDNFANFISNNFDVNCTSYLVDISNYKEVEMMFNDIFKKYNKLDVLVNNAGISKIGLFSDLDEDSWDTIINTNLKSLYNCCHFAIPSMVHEKKGSIINISSMWGISGASCEVAYSASKGGVNSLTKALAKELGPSDIRVNAIACGVIDTDMNKWLDKEEKQELIDSIPLSRFGNVTEVANLAFYLANDNSSYITGQIISVDGGII